MLALLSFLKGYLTITVSGTFCERFLNVCAAKNILLWDITRISKQMLRCKISVPAFRHLLSISYHTGVKVHILSRHGFPFVLYKYRKRKLLLASGAIISLFFIFANQFVWDIEIRGNEQVKTADILTALKEEGVTLGIPKSKIDQQYLKNRMLIRMPSLAWLWADKRGSKIIVDVRERIPVPEIYNPDDYCNITATKDAIIDSMIVKSGIPVVKEGDTVLKGTVLVTGKITSDLKPEVRYVNAEAEVFARVWYEKNQQFSRISKIRTETGQSKKRFTLVAFGRNIPLWKGDIPYEIYDKETRRHELSVFGNYLGITLLSDTYTEIELHEEIHTAKSTADRGMQVIKGKIEENINPTAVLTAFSHSYKEMDETTVEVVVQAEYLENIAQKVSGEATDSPNGE